MLQLGRKSFMIEIEISHGCRQQFIDAKQACWMEGRSNCLDLQIPGADSPARMVPIVAHALLRTMPGCTHPVPIGYKATGATGNGSSISFTLFPHLTRASMRTASPGSNTTYLIAPAPCHNRRSVRRCTCDLEALPLSVCC
jgi:hypothetical protein